MIIHNNFCRQTCQRIAKILLISILILMILPSLTFSQQVDSIKISGNYNNSSLIGFFSEIELNYAVKFYYKSEWIQNLKFSKSFADVSLRSALTQIFNETPYLIESLQNAIIVLPKEAVAIATGRMTNLTNGLSAENLITIGNINDGEKSRKAYIKGTITSSKGNSPVIGAEIQVANTKLGAVTDNNGEYSIELPTGLLNLTVNGIGFEVSIISIKLLSSGNLDIQLSEKSIVINEVIISGQRADKNVSSNKMSIVELDSKQIKQLSQISGTKDILKSMTMVAGVKSVGEFGSDIYVRGGSGDQNLYLIEGTPVFNTAHVLGFISVLNSDIISNLTLHKGDIPAKYGERISSLMDIEVKKEIPKKIHGYGGIGLIDSRLTLEAPIIKDKLSFLISGRFTYSDWILKKIPDVKIHNSEAKFYDLNGALYWNLNLKNKISVFFYASNDNFNYNNELNYSYGNLMGSAKWQHRYGQYLNSVFSIHASNYEITKNETEQLFEKSNTTSMVDYYSAKLNFEYINFKRHFLEWGLQTIFYRLNPGRLVPSDSVSLIEPYELNQEQANETAFYISDRFELSHKLSIYAGIRVSAFFNYGPSTIFSYDPYQTKSVYSVQDSTNYGNNQIVSSFTGIEPRLSLKYQINESSSVKLNYNRNFQYISLISYTSVFTPDDRWKLSDPFLEPIQCDQIALGYFKNFKNNSIVSSVELYYKKMENLIEYKNGAKISMNPTIENELISARGKNYGIELSFKRTSKKLETWLNYTWSRSLKQTSGNFPEEKINNNIYYPSNYDKPHELNAFLMYHINRRWRFSANFVYASGRSTTLPEMKYQIDGNWAIQYSDRNKYRLPSYNRLDLSISINESIRIKKKWKGNWTISVINVYGRNNAYSIFYQTENPTIQNDLRSSGLYKLYIIGQPIPTITYNFIF